MDDDDDHVTTGYSEASLRPGARQAALAAAMPRLRERIAALEAKMASGSDPHVQLELRQLKSRLAMIEAAGRSPT